MCKRGEEQYAVNNKQINKSTSTSQQEHDGVFKFWWLDSQTKMLPRLIRICVWVFQPSYNQPQQCVR